jgi:hypothetical protein
MDQETARREGGIGEARSNLNRFRHEPETFRTSQLLDFAQPAKG